MLAIWVVGASAWASRARPALRRYSRPIDRPDHPRLARDHPLAGCEEKLWRANEHFESLQAEIIRLGTSQLATFRTEASPNTPNALRTVVTTVVEPDLRLATILGDMIHNLRSSLDHLVFELAFLGLRGKRVPDKTAFPASLTRQNWESPHVQGVLLEGVLKKHRAMLYQAQPCYRKRDSASPRAKKRRKRNPIADLQGLWNDDKHRMVQPVVFAPNEMRPQIGPWEDCHPIRAPIINLDFLGHPVKAGTEVLVIPVEVTGPNPRITVKIEIAGSISLRNGFPVLDAMMSIANYVQAILLRFEPVFETTHAHELWELPRGGWVEREHASWGRAQSRGWKLERAPPSDAGSGA